MNSSKEFQKYATKHTGISSLSLYNYTSAYGNYINPTITEEITENRRQVTMDVFSRLMQDRIIFLGVPINDTVANIIQAQLLFLESAGPKDDIEIFKMLVSFSNIVIFSFFSKIFLSILGISGL